MAKKYVAICLCVLAVCAVFGLNARTDYEQVKRAVEHVNESANTIIEDVTLIDCFSYIFEDFRMGQETNVEYIGYSNDGFFGTGYVVKVSVNRGTHESASGTEHGGFGSRFFTFQREETALRIMNALEPLTWKLNEDSPNSFWGNILGGITSAVNAIVLLLGVIFTLLQTIFIFITDAISTAWSAVEMGLYILGLPVAL